MAALEADASVLAGRSVVALAKAGVVPWSLDVLQEVVPISKQGGPLGLGQPQGLLEGGVPQH